MFGEKECIDDKPWPVQVVAATNNTHLLMISRKNALRRKKLTNNNLRLVFSDKELEILKTTASKISFPTEQDVIADIEVLRKT